MSLGYFQAHELARGFQGRHGAPRGALNFVGGFVGDDLFGGEVADEGQNEQRRDNGHRLVHGSEL